MENFDYGYVPGAPANRGVVAEHMAEDVLEDLSVSLDEVDSLARVNDDAELFGPVGGSDREIVLITIGQGLLF